MLDLVGMLDLQGRTATADALHCQRRTAQALLDGHANSVLAVKENQPALLADVHPVARVADLLPWNCPDLPSRLQQT